MSDSFYTTAVRERPNGRIYFLRSEIEAHKRRLAGLPAQPFVGPDQLVPITQTAFEFGKCSRTLKRAIAAARAEAAANSTDQAA